MDVLRQRTSVLKLFGEYMVVQQSDPELQPKLGFSLLHHRLILKSSAKLVLLEETSMPPFRRGTFLGGSKSGIYV